MMTTNVKSTTTPAAGLTFERDEHGLLYCPAIRSRVTDAERLPQNEAIAALMVTAKRLHQRRQRWAEKQGLSEGRLEALSVLGHCHDQGLALGELAEILNVSPRNVTGLIDGLEGDGMVRRVPDPRDRRSVHAQLTPLGRKRVQSVWQALAVQPMGVTAGLSDDELRQLRHLCLRLLKNLNEIGEDA
jgi:DNA-binding MarR family transcriptional regulator